VEARISLFDINVAAGTFFCVLLHPFQRLADIWISMLTMAVILAANHVPVPRNLMPKAHLEFTLCTCYTRVHTAIAIVTIQLPVVAAQA
jgi:hypothetical protein